MAGVCIRQAGPGAGLLVATRIRPLPWPGRTGGGSLQLERLFVRADQPIEQIANALRAAAREWAAARGIDRVDLRGDSAAGV